MDGPTLKVLLCNSILEKVYLTCKPEARLASSRLIYMCQKSDRRAMESRGDDLSRLHGFKFNLHIVGGKIRL